jgi:hypothetical protein
MSLRVPAVWLKLRGPRRGRREGLVSRGTDMLGGLAGWPACHLRGRVGTAKTYRSRCQAAASRAAHSTARSDASEPSVPTMMGLSSIAFSFGRCRADLA